MAMKYEASFLEGEKIFGHLVEKLWHSKTSDGIFKMFSNARFGRFFVHLTRHRDGWPLRASRQNCNNKKSNLRFQKRVWIGKYYFRRISLSKLGFYVFLFGRIKSCKMPKNIQKCPKLGQKFPNIGRCRNTEPSGTGPKVDCLKSKLVQISNIHCIWNPNQKLRFWEHFEKNVSEKQTFVSETVGTVIECPYLYEFQTLSVLSNQNN